MRATAAGACRASHGGVSCSQRRRRSSSRRAITPLPWTTSRIGRVLYQHFPGKRELYLALLDESIEALIQAVREALASTTDNKQRVHATVQAYFSFVEDQRGAFKLVFESDLIGEPAVRERLDGVERVCAEAISEIIAQDTGLPSAESHLLAAGLAGIAQVTARAWASGGDSIPRDTAINLVASLVWRGISGFPRREERQP
jgi:AcrR family transcriptional regulator